MARKIIVYVALTIAVLFCLSGCGNSGNTLMQNASPSTSVLCRYRYDGEIMSQGMLSNQSVEEEILASLSKVGIKKVEGWSTEDITYPIYGFWIGSKDDNTVEAAWSNGYWITGEGEVYSFDYDFEKLIADYDWGIEETNTRFTGFPCARTMSINNGQWDKEMLVAATEPESPADVRLEVIEQTENIITAELTNQSKFNWDHGTSYWVEVCLEDVWYAIPTVPGSWGFTMELHIFPPGESETKKFYLDMYGKLPAGKYRINFQGVLAEFEIE